LPVDAFGVWTNSASKYLTELISAAADRRGACRSDHRSVMWRKFAAVLIGAKADRLQALM
jgi:hypothetical protein